MRCCVPPRLSKRLRLVGLGLKGLIGSKDAQVCRSLWCYEPNLNSAVMVVSVVYRRAAIGA